MKQQVTRARPRRGRKEEPNQRTLTSFEVFIPLLCRSIGDGRVSRTEDGYSVECDKSENEGVDRFGHHVGLSEVVCVLWLIVARRCCNTLLRLYDYIRVAEAVHLHTSCSYISAWHVCHKKQLGLGLTAKVGGQK